MALRQFPLGQPVQWIDDTFDPTTLDDRTAGVRRGHRWINLLTGVEWLCLSETTAQAVWFPTSSGNGNQASAPLSMTVGGDSNTADFDNAVCVGGQNNNAGANDVVVVGGSGNEVSGDKSASVGGTDATVTGGSSVSVGGDGNLINGDRSVNVGGTGNSITEDAAVAVGGTDNTVGGAGSVSVGGDGNVISSPHAVAVGGVDNTISGSESSSVGGRLGLISGDHAVMLGGTDNEISGDNSVTIGNHNEVSGHDSVAMGTSHVVTGDNSLAVGSYGEVSNSGQFAVSAAYQFIVSLVLYLVRAQSSKLMLAGRSTTASTTYLEAANGLGLFGYLMPAKQTWFVRASIVGRRIGTDQTGIYEVLFWVKRGTGSLTVTTIRKDVHVETDPTWDVAVSGSSGLGFELIQVGVTGAVGSTIAWSAALDILSVSDTEE